VIYKLIKVSFQIEMSDIGRKVVHRLVAITSQCEVGDGRGQVVDELVELPSNGKLSHIGREVVYTFLEVPSKEEVQGGGRRDVHGGGHHQSLGHVVGECRLHLEGHVAYFKGDGVADGIKEVLVAVFVYHGEFKEGFVTKKREEVGKSEALQYI